MANYFVDSHQLEILNNTVVTWPGGTTEIPLGRPECGFDSEFCPPEKGTGKQCSQLKLGFLFYISVEVILSFHLFRKKESLTTFRKFVKI